jgi:hypothetical protein
LLCRSGSGESSGALTNDIQFSAYDLEKVKQKSAAEGLPYQTLISSVIHKYITGKLVDEQAILKSLQLLNGQGS